MNATAPRPIDKLARGTAVGIAGYCTFIMLYNILKMSYCKEYEQN